jgi:hypothetical protein
MMRRRDLWLVIAIAVLGSIVFVPSITGSWVFDDRPLIAENPFVHSFAWAGRWFVTDFWNVGEEVRRFGSAITYWRPGITVTYAVDWAIGGGSPVVFHVMNLLYQACVCVLAFFVLRRWIGKAIPAAAAALVFAIHPTKAESVAWIAGRTDVICMLAVLVASQGMAWRLAGRRLGYVLEIAGTVVAYLCKEQAIVLPAFAAVEAWLALGRPAIDVTTIRKLIPRVIPQTVLAVGYLVIRAAVLPIQSSVGASKLAPLDHLVAVLETFGRFASLTFAPHELSLQHGLVHLSGGEPIRSIAYAIVGASVLVAFLAGAFLARKRWPWLTLGIAFFLVTIAPTSNIVYAGMETLVSERFLYLPVFGLAWQAGELLARVPSRYVRPAYALTAAVAIAFAMLSLSRSADFVDERAFWARELELHPDSKQAMQYAVTTANREARYRDGLALLLHMHERMDRYDRDPGRDIFFAHQVADVTSRLLPDNRKAELRAIDRFVEQLLAGNPASLHVLEVRLDIGALKDEYRREVTRFAPLFLALRAELAGRLGDDAHAIVLAEQARGLCGRCSTTVHIIAIAYARAGRYTDSLAVLDETSGLVPEKVIEVARSHVEKAMAAHAEAARTEGPAQLRARAQELAALELWGRAYDVLAPYKDQLKQAPGAAKGFAELAFRAGEPAIAREVLAASLSAAEIEELLTEWATKMGWAS